MQPPKTIIFDFDSTLVSIESLDEVIALSLQVRPDQEEVLRRIRSITDQGMNGEIDLSESLQLRLSAARIHRRQVQQLAATITQYITPGIDSVIERLQQEGVAVLIFSGGFSELIMPVADRLKIPLSAVYGNSYQTDAEGFIVSVDLRNPLSTSHGKVDQLRQLLAHGVVNRPVTVVGDGVSDLHPFLEGVADDFIGFGVHCVRAKVRRQAPRFVEGVEGLKSLLFTS